MLIPSIAVLLAVLGAAAAALWYAKRRGVSLAIAPGRRRLRVLERLPLSRQAALLLVEVDGRVMLIAHNGERLALLSPADVPAREAPPHDPA